MRILTAIDFSELTAPVCRLAARLSRLDDAELLLVHVAAPEPDFIGYDPGPHGVRRQRAAELRAEHSEIAVLAEELQSQGVRATPRMVAGPTAATLLELAMRDAVELIVMGSHGHGALASALIGSVSAEVLRRAPCPVVIVPRSSLSSD